MFQTKKKKTNFFKERNMCLNMNNHYNVLMVKHTAENEEKSKIIAWIGTKFGRKLVIMFMYEKCRPCVTMCNHAFHQVIKQCKVK